MPRNRRLRISAAARADLSEIDAYGAEQFGDVAADAYTRRFAELFALLRDQPFAGQAEPDLGADLRRITHRRHRVFYRVDDRTIIIVRVLHAAQDAARALRS